MNYLVANQRRHFAFAALTAIVFLFATQIQVAAQNEFKGYKVGRYEGDIVNTTYNVKGTAAFEIRKIDRASGEVTAFLTPTSSNLSGEGTLTGKIDEKGVLRVSGPIAGTTASVVARVSGDTIKANYRLSGSSIQNGTFTAKLMTVGGEADDIPVPDVDEQPQKNRSNQNQPPITGDATAECNFAPPAPKYSNSDSFSLKLAERVIFDSYGKSANGTLSAPLRVGTVFSSFVAGKSYKNTVRIDPGRGALRINDAAPPNVMIYRVKSTHIICEEYRDGVQRRQVEAEYDCFKKRDGEWICGSSGMFPKITQLK